MEACGQPHHQAIKCSVTEPGYPLNRKQGKSKSQSGLFGQKKNLLLQPCIDVGLNAIKFVQ